MNKRQEVLYQFLLDVGEWVNQETVAYELFEYYGYLGDGNFSNSTARRMMTADIQAINEDLNVEKIIIQGNKGIKIASQEEFNRYISSQYASVFRRLKRIRIKEQKAKKHNCYMFNEDETTVIDAFLEKFN